MMLKQAIKHVGAVAAGRLGLWSALERAHRDTWTIVCYHRVLPHAERTAYFCPDLVVTPEALRAHCAVYREHFEVLPVRDAFERVQAGASGPKPLLSLSFDDGYRDNFAFAAPILAEFGLSASFYVIAGLVDTEELPWYDKIACLIKSDPESFWQGFSKEFTDAPVEPNALSRRMVEESKALETSELLRLIELTCRCVVPPDPDLDLIMTSAQLRQLHREGHEIASHSLTHPILTKLEAEKLPDELGGARSRLGELLGAPVDTFCYPNGDFNTLVLEETRSAGYTAALSTRQGLNRADTNPFELQRVFIHEDWLKDGAGQPSPALLRAELALLHRFRR